MRNLRQHFNTLILVFMSFALVGCDVEEPKYNDNSCINSLNDLVTGSSYDIDKATGEPCFSLDTSVRKLKTHYTVQTANGVLYEPYRENQYINEDTAARYNAMANSKNENGKRQQVLKQKLNNVYLGIVDDSDAAQYGIIVLAICFFLLYHFFINKESEEQSRNSPIKYFVSLVLISFALYQITNDEVVNVKLNDISIRINNAESRKSMINALNDFHSKSSNLVRKHSMNEAITDTLDLMKLNVCLSNNQKLHIENSQSVWYGRIESEKEMIDLYFQKNIPYIIGDEVSVNPFGDIETDAKKIGYYVNDLNLITGVKFADCGEVKFVSYSLSSSTIERMKAVNFSKHLSSALSAKAYKNNLDFLVRDFQSEYGDSVSENDELIELVVLFSIEYKKGLIFGYVKPKDKENPTRTIDATHLSNNLSYADSMYVNLSEAQCLKRGDLVKDSIKAIEEFQGGSDTAITQTECISFDETELVPATLTPYAYHENKLLVDEKIRSVLDLAEPTVLEAAKQLSNEYKIVNDEFVKTISELSNLDKSLTYLWNQGGESHGKFLNILYSQSNDYIKTHALLLDVSRMDYSLALPSFTLDDEPMIDTDINQVNALLKPLSDLLDTDTELVSMNVSNSMLEYKLDNTAFNVGDVFTGGTSAISDALTNFKEATSKKLSSFARMTCNGKKSECDEMLLNYDGVKEWNQSADTAIEIGVPAVLIGTAGNITFSATEALLKFGKKKPKANTKTAKFGKRSKSGALNVVNSGLKTTSEIVQNIGITAIVLGYLMKAVYFIPTVVGDWYHTTQFYYSELMVFLPITMLWIVVSTKYTVNAMKYGVYLIICAFAYMPLMSFLIPMITHLIHNGVISILNAIPSISGLMMTESNGTMDQITNIIIALIGVLFVVMFSSIMLAKSVLASARKLTSKTSFDSASNQATQLMSNVESVAQSTSGYKLTKTMNKRLLSKTLNKKKKGNNVKNK